MRDFQYDENSLEKQKKEAEETIASEREQQQVIIRLAKTNFSEVFSSWVHLKALRVFVESVLRYGLPPDFTSAVIEVSVSLHSPVNWSSGHCELMSAYFPSSPSQSARARSRIS